MYKVKNIGKDTRKFWDGDKGRDILVGPGQSTLTNRPPEESEFLKVEEHEEKTKKKIKEVDIDDSSSS